MARRKPGDPVHGWIALDKPLGLSSTQALGKARRLLNAQKAGHAGTLDPLASGVLPLAFGEATKTVPLLVDAAKAYRFTVRWGAETETCDAEGAVTARSDVRPDQAAIEAALSGFTGEITQIPPAYSAVKVDGERAYARARRGESVEIKPRQVRVDALRLVDLSGPDEAVFEVECGKGLYVRSLARDLARALGTAGHVAALRRTRVGAFKAEQCWSLDALEDLAHKASAADALAPVQRPLDDIPEVEVTGQEARSLKQGREIVLLPRIAKALREQARPRTIDGKDASRWALALVDGQLAAIVDARMGRLKPVRVFNLF